MKVFSSWIPPRLSRRGTFTVSLKNHLYLESEEGALRCTDTVGIIRTCYGTMRPLVSALSMGGFSCQPKSRMGLKKTLQVCAGVKTLSSIVIGKNIQRRIGSAFCRGKSFRICIIVYFL